MKTLFQTDTFSEIIKRVNNLTPQTQKQWGKMNVDQMIAHCSVSFKSAVGDIEPERLFIFKIIGPFFKSMTTNDKPFRKESPTGKDFIIGNTKGFENEKEELLKHINNFHAGGEAGCTKKPHAFFGKLSPTQWGSLMYKHLDHHLRQFGV